MSETNNMMRFTSEEIMFIKNNYTEHGSMYCAEKLKRSRRSITTKAYRMGIKMSSSDRSKLYLKQRRKSHDEYSVDASQFISDVSKESAYILGILWADGHVVLNKKGGRIQISCVKDDIMSINWVFDKTGRWNKCFNQYRHYKPQCVLYISNRPLAEFLHSKGYAPNTFCSADGILDIIPCCLKKYWFRGLIDGDGCWYFNKDSNLRQFCLSGHYEQVWSYFTDLLDLLDIKYSVKRSKGPKGNYSCVRITNKSGIEKLGAFVYSGFDVDCVGLERKHNKYLEITL